MQCDNACPVQHMKQPKLRIFILLINEPTIVETSIITDNCQQKQNVTQLLN